MSPMRHLLRPPRLWSQEDSPTRRVTWLELFFDLIFVAAVAQVGQPLTTDYSFAGLARYTFMFVLIWWAWTGHTLYTTRFDTDDVVQRLLTLVQVIAVALMAANAKDALSSKSSAGFAAAYAVMRFVLVAQYAHARQIPAARGLAQHFAIGFGVAASLWLCSAFVEPPLRFWFWGAALLIDVGTPFAKLRHAHELPPDPAHLPERFGLFTIILMGEAVAAVMRGMEQQETWYPPAAISAFVGLATVFALWWWYFDGVSAAAERNVRTRRQARWFHVWSYCHLPLYLALAVAFVGIEHVVRMVPGTHLHSQEAWLFSSAVTLTMMLITLIGASSDEALSAPHWRQRLLTRLAVSCLPLLGGIWGSEVLPVYLVLLFALTAILQLSVATRDSLAASGGGAGENMSRVTENSRSA